MENEDLTSTGQMLQEGPRRTGRVRLLTIAGIVIVAVVGGLVLLLKSGADGYYILTPGQAPVVTAAKGCRPVGGGSFSLPGGQPCVQLVLPADRVHPVDGRIMMVDVFEGKPNPWQYLIHSLGLDGTFQKHTQWLPNSAIIGNGTASQLDCQNTQQAVEATSAAPTAALRRLGYAVGEVDLGAQVDTVVSGTPAARAGLQCNDLITAVDGHPVHVAGDVAAALKGLAPGTEVKLAVTRAGSGAGARTRYLVVDARLAPTPAIDGQPARPSQGFLGISSETRTRYDYPFPVSVQVGSIGGPSDGLALALGIMDSLSGGHLTGGMDVAATGEIDPRGDVIEIGGAAQKAVAVRHAGAKVFIVPEANYAAAESQAGSMKVLGVSTLEQALADLRQLGGQIPAAPPPTPTTSVAGK